MDKKLVIRVLIGNVNTLLDFKKNKEYFSHIPKILSYLIEMIDSTNQNLTKLILGLINAIFSWYKMIDIEDHKEELEV